MSPPAAFPAIVFRAEDYQSAGEGLGRIRDGASDVHKALQRTLSGYGGMAGSDDAGTSWAKTYDDAVGAAMQSSSKLAATSGRIGDLLTTGAHNHAVAEAAANGVAPPPAPVLVAEVDLATNVPSASGGGGAEPFG